MPSIGQTISPSYHTLCRIEFLPCHETLTALFNRAGLRLLLLLGFRRFGKMFHEDRKKKSNVNGIEEKGVVGRGILIDYDRWRI